MIIWESISKKKNYYLKIRFHNKRREREKGLPLLSRLLRKQTYFGDENLIHPSKNKSCQFILKITANKRLCLCLCLCLVSKVAVRPTTHCLESPCSIPVAFIAYISIPSVSNQLSSSITLPRLFISQLILIAGDQVGLLPQLKNGP